MKMLCGTRTCLLVMCMLVLSILFGCGPETLQKPAESGPKEAGGVLLPNWAPEYPSPEFLRTAKALKPLPDEFPDYTLLLRACYELFGTLSDEQIADFLQPKQHRIPLESAEKNNIRDFLEKQRGAKVTGNELVYKVNEISLPVKSLTPPQRAALENLFLEWGREYVGTEHEDLLVRLYKMGANEDLSNVTLRFEAQGHVVSLGYMILISEQKTAQEITTRCTGSQICQFAQL